MEYPRNLTTPYSRLCEELSLARADGSYGQKLAKLQRAQLLILDDFGLAPVTEG